MRLLVPTAAHLNVTGARSESSRRRRWVHPSATGSAEQQDAPDHGAGGCGRPSAHLHVNGRAQSVFRRVAAARQQRVCRRSGAHHFPSPSRGLDPQLHEPRRARPARARARRRVPCGAWARAGVRGAVAPSRERARRCSRRAADDPRARRLRVRVPVPVRAGPCPLPPPWRRCAAAAVRTPAVHYPI